MLVGVHGARIDVDVGVELLHADRQAALLSNMPIEALVSPLPSELTTPPVTKICLLMEKAAAGEGSNVQRGHCRTAGGNGKEAGGVRFQPHSRRLTAAGGVVFCRGHVEYAGRPPLPTASVGMAPVPRPIQRTFPPTPPIDNRPHGVLTLAWQWRGTGHPRLPRAVTPRRNGQRNLRSGKIR